LFSRPADPAKRNTPHKRFAAKMDDVAEYWEDVAEYWEESEDPGNEGSQREDTCLFDEIPEDDFPLNNDVIEEVLPEPQWYEYGYPIPELDMSPEALEEKWENSRREVFGVSYKDPAGSDGDDEEIDEIWSEYPIISVDEISEPLVMPWTEELEKQIMEYYETIPFRKMSDFVRDDLLFSFAEPEHTRNAGSSSTTSTATTKRKYNKRPMDDATSTMSPPSNKREAEFEPTYKSPRLSSSKIKREAEFEPAYKSPRLSRTTPSRSLVSPTTPNDKKRKDRGTPDTAENESEVGKAASNKSPAPKSKKNFDMVMYVYDFKDGDIVTYDYMPQPNFENHGTQFFHNIIKNIPKENDSQRDLWEKEKFQWAYSDVEGHLYIKTLSYIFYIYKNKKKEQKKLMDVITCKQAAISPNGVVVMWTTNGNIIKMKIGKFFNDTNEDESLMEMEVGFNNKNFRVVNISVNDKKDLLINMVNNSTSTYNRKTSCSYIVLLYKNGILNTTYNPTFENNKTYIILQNIRDSVIIYDENSAKIGELAEIKDHSEFYVFYKCMEQNKIKRIVTTTEGHPLIYTEEKLLLYKV